MNDKFIRVLARFITEDPNVFVETKQKSKDGAKPASKSDRGLKQKPKTSGVKAKDKPKAKKNKPTEEAFGKEFRTMLGLEDKPEPADPNKKDRSRRRVPEGLEGAKQSGSAYLK